MEERLVFKTKSILTECSYDWKLFTLEAKFKLDNENWQDLSLIIIIEIKF